MNSRGFTLIEMILTLVLVAIISVVAGMGIVKVTEGMVFAQRNASTSLKMQVALTRLEKEFHIISGVTSTATSPPSLTYVSSKGGVSGTHTLTSSVPNIRLDGNVLVDNVTTFSLTYLDTYNGTESSTWIAGTSKVIKVTFAITGAAGVINTFTMRVTPRML